MEIKLLDSILHGELRPWLLDTTDKKHFSAIVKTAKAVSPGTYAELQKKISDLLSSFPALQKIVNEKPPTAKAVLQSAFYEIAFPEYTDVITHFYSLLIASETLRVSNLLSQQVATITDQTVIRYDVKQALKSIRVLAKQIVEEMQNSGFASVPDANSQLTHFVLFALKQMLTALFFEVQERYRNVLSEFETEESFHKDILEQTTAFTPRLKPTPDYFEFQIQHIISSSAFSKPDAVALLKQMQTLQDAKLQTVQAALENLIFLHSQNAENISISFDQLTSPDFITQHFSVAKKSITQEIGQLNFGYQRLEVVNNALSELDYILQTPINKFSVAQKISFWLQENKVVYSAAPEKFFSVEPDAEQELKKGNKPLAKKSQTTTDMQKQVAFEHLKFMSGFNRLNQKIMPDADFTKLTNSVAELIDTGKAPRISKGIAQTGLENNFIRYTFYKLHEQLYTTKKIKQSWIDFLHSMFAQFGNTAKTTTKAKFSEMPKSYTADIEAMKKVI